jgi:hypothetical protein
MRNTWRRKPTLLNQNDLDWFAARLSIAVYDVNRITPEMSAYELQAALKDITGSEQLTISYAQNGNQLIHIGDRTVEVGPMASNDEIRLALQNPFIRTENTKMSVSPLNRLKEKALQARSVAPDAIRAFEADLDSIIAEKPVIDQKRVDAVSPHKEAIAGVKGELDDLKSAIDILSNGASE